jgi:hypothetical protein
MYKNSIVVTILCGVIISYQGYVHGMVRASIIEEIDGCIERIKKKEICNTTRLYALVSLVPPHQSMSYGQKSDFHPDIKGKCGYSTLMVAARLNSVALARKILELNPRLDDADMHYNMTALHIAAHHGNLAFVKLLLLTDGADSIINIPDIFGNTPLHHAVQNPSINSDYPDYSDKIEDALLIINMLFLNGANLNIGNNYGSTPLHIAASRRNTEFVRLLLELKSDITIKDEQGKTALELFEKSIPHNYVLPDDLHTVLSQYCANTVQSLLQRSISSSSTEVLPGIIPPALSSSTNESQADTIDELIVSLQKLPSDLPEHSLFEQPSTPKRDQDSDEDEIIV